MKKSTKAALLSGLVFPGLGHLYLKRYAPGILLSVVAASALSFIVSVVMGTALDVVDKIQRDGTPLDIRSIMDLVSQHPSGSEQSANIAMIVLVACWLIGIADSYRQGRAQEKHI